MMNFHQSLKSWRKNYTRCIDWENSNLIEGAYVDTVMSKKGIRPYDEGLSDLTNDNMVEGFSWDTVQVLNENQILSLKKYVQDNQLNIDVKSLEEGNGVLIIHDHMLTPEQQKLADEAIILIVKRNNRKTNSLKKNLKHLLYVVI